MPLPVPNATHPSQDELRAFGLGKLDDPATDAVLAHLDACPDCFRVVKEASGDNFVNRLRAARQPGGTSVPGKSLSGLARNFDAPAASPVHSIPPELANNPEYARIEELGRGGMGVVYKAHNTLMGRDEVLKVMSREIMARPGAIDRFRREIQSAARLDHPNIVKAYSARLFGDLLAFSMEYVPGDDLGKLVRSRGQLPVANACYYVQQVANGLQHAHEKGMVHRDIKPANLILHRESKKHVVKILDFGLAKVTSEAGFDGNLTGEGKMLGTPDYIAPEQIMDAQSADIRADIYSLGCTLYFLLVGNPPFSATSLYELLRQHREVDAPVLNLVRPDVPAELAAVVAKMMAKDPAKRFRTPAEVSKALVPFLKPGAVPAKPQAVVAKPPKAAATKQHGGLARPHEETAIPHSTSVELVAVPAAVMGPPAASPQADAWGSMMMDSAADTVPAGVKKPAPQRKSAPSRPKWLWPVGLAGGALMVLAVLLASGVFKVKTKDGTIVVEGLPADAEVMVDGETVTVSRNGEKATVTMNRGGPHQLKVVQGGKEILSSDLTVTIGGEPVRVRVEKAVAAVTPKPPVVPDKGKPSAEPTQPKLAEKEKDPATPAEKVTEDQMRQRIETAWPGLGKCLSKDEAGKYTLNLRKCGEQVTDLKPLEGMPLISLNINYCSEVRDLSPLQGMKLKSLSIGRCGQIKDLSPLQGMELDFLDLAQDNQLDLTQLKGMTIHHLFLWNCHAVKDLRPLESIHVKVLTLSYLGFQDLAPLKGSSVTELCLDHCDRFSDLRPLKDLSITALNLTGCNQINDLTPLKDLPLISIAGDFKPERDGNILRDIKTLQVINGIPVAEFVKRQETPQAKPENVPLNPKPKVDDIQAKLDEAKAAYEVVVQTIKKDAAARFEELEGAARKKGDVKATDRLKEVKDVFEARLLLPDELPFQSFNSRLVSARKKLVATYKSVSAEYVRAKQPAEADNVVNELAKFQETFDPLQVGSVWLGTWTQQTQGDAKAVLFDMTLKVIERRGTYFKAEGQLVDRPPGKNTFTPGIDGTIEYDRVIAKHRLRFADFKGKATYDKFSMAFEGVWPDSKRAYTGSFDVKLKLTDDK